MNSIVLTRAFVVIDALDKTGKAYTSVMSRFTGMASRIASIGARLNASMIMPTMALKKVISDYVKFEDQMLSLKAITGSNQKEFERMCSVARRFGKEVTFSVQQVAEAMTEMGRAGFNTKEIEDSFQSVLDFARATKIELKESADFISSTLKTFSAGPEFARKIADSLTAAANSSAVTPREIMSAMRMSASIMAQVGMDVKDYLEAIGALGNFGIRGTLAGTVMRRAGTKLANEGMIEQFRKVGVDVYDKSGNMRNLIEVLSEYRTALKQRGFTDNQIIARLSSQSGFGMYGAAGIIALSSAADEKGNRKFQELKDALDNSAGMAAIVAAEMDSGIGGAIRYLVASLQELNIVLGRALAPMVRNFAGQIKGWTNAASIFFEENQGLVTSAATAFVGLTALGTAMFVVGTAAMPLVSTLGMIGEAFVGLTGILSTTFGYLNVIVAEYAKGFMGGLKYAGIAVENRKRLVNIDEANLVYSAAEARAESRAIDRNRILNVFKNSTLRNIEKKRLENISEAEATFASKFSQRSDTPLLQPERDAVYDILNQNRIGKISEADLKLKDVVYGKNLEGVFDGLTTEERSAKLAELAGEASPLMKNANKAKQVLDENFLQKPMDVVEKKNVELYERGWTIPIASDNRDYYYSLDDTAKKSLQKFRTKYLNPLLERIAREREDLANQFANRRIGGDALNLFEGEEVRGTRHKQGLRASENATITRIGKKLGNVGFMKSKEASSAVAQLLSAKNSIEAKREDVVLSMLRKTVEESREGKTLFKNIKKQLAQEAVESNAEETISRIDDKISSLKTSQQNTETSDRLIRRREYLQTIVNGENTNTKSVQKAMSKITDDMVKGDPRYEKGLKDIAEKELANKSSAFRARFVERYNKIEQKYSEAFSRLQSKLITILKENEERVPRENAKLEKQRDVAITKANTTSIKEKSKVGKRAEKVASAIGKRKDEEVIAAWQEQQNAIKANDEVRQAAPWWRGKIAPKKGTQTSFDKMRKAFSRSLEYGSEGSVQKMWANARGGFGEMWKGTKEATKGIYKRGMAGLGLPSVAEDVTASIKVLAGALNMFWQTIKYVGTSFAELWKLIKTGEVSLEAFVTIFKSFGNSALSSGFNVFKLLGNGFNMFWGMLRNSWLIAVEVFIRVLYYGNYWKAFLGALVVAVAAVVGAFVLMCKIMNTVIVVGSKVIAQFVKLAAGIMDVVGPILLLVGGTCIGALVVILNTVYTAVVELWTMLGKLFEGIGNFLSSLTGFDVLDSLSNIAEMFTGPITRAFKDIKNIISETVSVATKMIKAGDTESAFQYIDVAIQEIGARIKLAYIQIKENVKHFCDTSLSWITRAVKYIMGGKDREEAKSESEHVREYRSLSTSRREELRKYGVGNENDYATYKKYLKSIYSSFQKEGYRASYDVFERDAGSMILRSLKTGGNITLTQHGLSFASAGTGAMATPYEDPNKIERMSLRIIDFNKFKNGRDYANLHESEEQKRAMATVSNLETQRKGLEDVFNKKEAFNREVDSLITKLIERYADAGAVVGEGEKTLLEKLLKIVVQKAEIETTEEFKKFKDALDVAWDSGSFGKKGPSIAANVAAGVEKYGKKTEQLDAFVEDLKEKTSTAAKGSEFSYDEESGLTSYFRDMGESEIFEAWSPGLVKKFGEKEAYGKETVTVKRDDKEEQVEAGLVYSRENKDLFLRKIMYDAMAEQKNLLEKKALTPEDDERLGVLNAIIYNLQKKFWDVDTREGDTFSSLDIVDMEEDREKTFQAWKDAIQESAQKAVDSEVKSSDENTEDSEKVSSSSVRELTRANTTAVASSSTNVVAVLNDLISAFNSEASLNKTRWDGLKQSQSNIDANTRNIATALQNKGVTIKVIGGD